MSRDIVSTSDTLAARLKALLPAIVDADTASAIVYPVLEALDDYIDARIAEALDREFNRGSWTRY